MTSVANTLNDRDEKNMKHSTVIDVNEQFLSRNI